MSENEVLARYTSIYNTTLSFILAIYSIICLSRKICQNSSAMILFFSILTIYIETTWVCMCCTEKLDSFNIFLNSKNGYMAKGGLYLTSSTLYFASYVFDNMRCWTVFILGGLVFLGGVACIVVGKKFKEETINYNLKENLRTSAFLNSSIEEGNIDNKIVNN